MARSLSSKVIEAKTCMTRYFNRIGDSMPYVDQVYLPHDLTKQDIYYVMKTQLQEQGVTTQLCYCHIIIRFGIVHLRKLLYSRFDKAL